MSDQNSWHWEWCPVCHSTGVVMRYAAIQSGTAPTVEEPCETCEGMGRMRVPNGYEIRHKPYTITVKSSNRTVEYV
jgi:DnaJ-class molecular chaperone